MRTRYARNNYAFIDGVNLHMTYEYLKWKVDYNKLLQWLTRTHNVTTAYYFIGYIKKYHTIYDGLKSCGYSLKHRQPTTRPPEVATCPNCNHAFTIPNSITCPSCNHTFVIKKSNVKCDCDADIALQVMDDINTYDKAIIISSDGDFDNLVKKLIQVNKLELVLAPCKDGCSSLLIRAARGRIDYLDEHRSEVEKK